MRFKTIADRLQLFGDDFGNQFLKDRSLRLFLSELTESGP